MAPKKAQLPIRLTSHPDETTAVSPVVWGAGDPLERGPILGSLATPELRNVIGSHSGSYGVYRALAVAAGALQPEHKPDLTNTKPTSFVGPHKAWGDPKKIVSLDPWGAAPTEYFSQQLADGNVIQPTIAITEAHINMPEIHDAVRSGRLKPDGKILKSDGDVAVTKAAVEPVWYLPGIAERFGIDEHVLRRGLFEHTGGMFPELVTRGDLDVFLPPIGGLTVYFFGDVSKVPDVTIPLAVRVHDECNGSDVFGSDICTCRPYLVHGIEVCIETAQQGGSGVIVYNRKEGRALGEVTKFLVYNARKRQEGGDSAAAYFHRTECVAGVQDMRFQELMPDVLHWMGIERIHRFISMSDMKHDAIVKTGISIDERVAIPDDLVPADAKVEMEAKKAAGYYTPDGQKPSDTDLKQVLGRKLEEEGE